MQGFETEKEIKHIIACFMRQYKELGYHTYCSEYIRKRLKHFRASMFKAQKTNDVMACYGVVVSIFWGLISPFDYCILDNSQVNLIDFKSINSSVHFLKAIQANKNFEETTKKFFFEQEYEYISTLNHCFELPKKYYEHYKDIIDKAGFKIKIKDE